MEVLHCYPRRRRSPRWRRRSPRSLPSLPVPALACRFSLPRCRRCRRRCRFLLLQQQRRPPPPPPPAPPPPPPPPPARPSRRAPPRPLRLRLRPARGRTASPLPRCRRQHRRRRRRCKRVRGCTASSPLPLCLPLWGPERGTVGTCRYPRCRRQRRLCRRLRRRGQERRRRFPLPRLVARRRTGVSIFGTSILSGSALSIQFCILLLLLLCCACACAGWFSQCDSLLTTNIYLARGHKPGTPSFFSQRKSIRVVVEVKCTRYSVRVVSFDTWK